VKRYLITDPTHYRDFENDLRKALSTHRPEYALYRDKRSANYRELAEVFCRVVGEFSEVKPLLHTDYQLSKELGCYGVHITSSDVERVIEAKKLDLFTVVSTHNPLEIEKAIELNSDAITYSPIFGYQKGEPKGVENLKDVVRELKGKAKVFALGGVTTSLEIEQLREIDGLYGFASIRAFSPD
jgi:thiamine monophosphate synthase